jgi:hypothetical protein
MSAEHLPSFSDGLWDIVFEREALVAAFAARYAELHRSAVTEEQRDAADGALHNLDHAISLWREALDNAFTADKAEGRYH